METGDKVKVTPKDGKAYAAVIRGVHETGYTLWMDGKKQDDGEVRTVQTSGPEAATVEAAK